MAFDANVPRPQPSARSLVTPSSRLFLVLPRYSFLVVPRLSLVPARRAAIVLRSDAIRKQLFGVPAFERLGPAGYTAEVSQRVYASAVEHAGLAVRNGYCAIADAVFSSPSDRQAIEHAAREANVPFVGLWLTASEDTLLARLDRRKRDVSDADAAVLRRQLQAQDAGAIEWHPVDASRPIDAQLHEARLLLRDHINDA